MIVQARSVVTAASNKTGLDMNGNVLHTTKEQATPNERNYLFDVACSYVKKEFMKRIK